jgi:LemA protein
MNKRLVNYLIAIPVFLLILYAVITYNELVKKEETVKMQWNELNSAYQRRLDLIPNLVNVVRGQADFEQTVLTQITEARSKAAQVSVTGGVDAEGYNRQVAAQNELAGAANRLLIRVENYPTLTGTQAFSGLQTQLEGTERRIKVARKDFNAAVADFNSSAKAFPTSLVARLFGFKPMEGFQADAGTDKAIEVKFK